MKDNDLFSKTIFALSYRNTCATCTFIPLFFREESDERLLYMSDSPKVVHFFPQSHIVVTRGGNTDPISLPAAWLTAASACSLVSTHWLVCLDTRSLALQSIDLRNPTAFTMRSLKVTLNSDELSD